jgi:hypothetical protein
MTGVKNSPGHAPNQQVQFSGRCGRPAFWSSRRQLASGAVVIYAAEFFRILRPASDASTANGIDTIMAVPFPAD